jgi:hypothetical protein
MNRPDLYDSVRSRPVPSPLLPALDVIDLLNECAGIRGIGQGATGFVHYRPPMVDHGSGGRIFQGSGKMHFGSIDLQERRPGFRVRFKEGGNHPKRALRLKSQRPL